MTTTNFTTGTVVEASWLNDVDALRYDSDGVKYTKYLPPGTGGSSRTTDDKLEECVSILDYGADNTGVSLCNTALTNAKAVCKTVYFPPGIYRIENYSLQDLRIIGARTSGANTGVNEQTVIEGSGDIFVSVNNASLEHLVLRNSSTGTRGKLLSCAAMDTKIGPFIDVEFRKATYHVYLSDSTKTLVDVLFRDCRFSDANTYSRYYNCGLFRYSEQGCYTQSNTRGLYISNTSSALICDSVFELQTEGGIYVENTATASDVIRSLKFQNIHFEANGQTTPSYDIIVNITLSLGRIEFDSCGFYLPTVADAVNLSSSPTLRIVSHNCTDLTFANVASGTVLTELATKKAGETNGVRVTNGDVRAETGSLISNAGFRALDGISTTISNVATPTAISMPAAGKARLVLVCDSTTEGVALLMLTNGVVTSISSTLTSITWSIVAGVLNGATTGGASSRVMFFNYIET